MHNFDWMIALRLVAQLSTSVLLGTDVLFLVVGAPALEKSQAGAATQVMGQMHYFGDRRMPIFGAAALVSSSVLAWLEWWRHHSPAYGAVSAALLVHLIIYLRFSQPINKIQTQAARSDRSLDNARVLQRSWDRTLIGRVIALAFAATVQILSS